MPTATYLSDRLTELRAAALASLTLARTGNDVPARVYRSHNRPAVDHCDGGLLAVYLDNPALLLSEETQSRGEQARQFRYVPLTRLIVEVWRCWPGPSENGGAPSVAVLDTAADDLARDGHALWTGLHLAREAGTLFPAADDWVDVTIGDLAPVGPQGMAAGWRVRLTLPLTAHQPPAI